MNLLIIDLDGTITKSDCIVNFSFFMLQRKKKLHFLLFFFLLFLLKFKIINNVKFKTLYSLLLLKNMGVNYLLSCAKEFVNSDCFRGNINPDVIDFISRYKDSEKVVITANYDFIAQTVSDFLSINECLCIKLDKANGKYTGLVSGIIPFGKNKMEVYQQFVKNKKYSKTVGIGDSKSDLPLLKCFNEGYMVKYNAKKNSTSFDIVSQ